MTHVGLRLDHVIESFRNDLYDGLQDQRRRAARSCSRSSRSPSARSTPSASSCGRWSSSRPTTRSPPAAARFGADAPGVEQVVICTPDKDLAQCVRGDARRDARPATRIDLRRGGGAGEVRRPPGVDPGLPGPRRRQRGRLSRAPRLGRQGRSAVLARYGHLEDIPANGSEWDVKGLRGAVTLAATLRDQWEDALLYRDLARLRTIEDGVPIPQQDVEELAGGAPTGRSGRRSATTGTCRGCATVRTPGGRPGRQDAQDLVSPSPAPRTAEARRRDGTPAPRRARTRESPCRRRTTTDPPCRSPAHRRAPR